MGTREEMPHLGTHHSIREEHEREVKAHGLLCEHSLAGGRGQPLFPEPLTDNCMRVWKEGPLTRGLCRLCQGGCAESSSQR